MSFSVIVLDDHHYEEEIIASLYLTHSETEIRICKITYFVGFTQPSFGSGKVTQVSSVRSC